MSELENSRRSLHRRVAVDLSSENPKTEQHHRDHVSTQFIMNKAAKTGMMQHVRQEAPTYSELPPRMHYQDAMNLIAAARSTFESIPAITREKFDNDPAQFLDFINNPENREQMLEMGFTDDHLPPPEPEPEPEPEPTPEPIPSPPER